MRPEWRRRRPVLLVHGLGLEDTGGAAEPSQSNGGGALIVGASGTFLAFAGERHGFVVPTASGGRLRLSCRSMLQRCEARQAD